jgi:hypothetical protein
VDKQTDAGTFAYQLTQHLGDLLGDENADAYLAEVVGELMLLCPSIKDRFSDELLGELKEEISRDDTEFAAACRNAIVMVEERWRNDD